MGANIGTCSDDITASLSTNANGKPQFSLETFNLIYNTLYTLVLLIFIDPLVNLVTSLVKDKQHKLEELSYIDERFLQRRTLIVLLLRWLTKI